MLQCLRKKNRKKQGFTLMEVMVVVGIIAVIAAIAIPSVISMQKNMDHRQRNDYAKTIFLAAQSNLADLRSTGELEKVEDESGTNMAVMGTAEENLPERFTERYLYTYNADTTRFDAVLPINAVEAVIRDQQIIIEYNPRTGSVYSVFYTEEYSDLLTDYQQGILQRSEEWLKKNLIGYYNGSDLTSEELGFYEVVASLSYENDQEGILYIDIPTQSNQSGVVNLVKNNEEYIKSLEIKLTVIGENSGMFTTTIKESGASVQFEAISGGGIGGSNLLRIPVVMDSLISGQGVINGDDNYVTDSNGDRVLDSKENPTFHVAPGDNVSLSVEVEYVPGSGSDYLILFDDAVLAGINPLFHSLTGDAASGYTIAISNGRHLQNLNAVAAGIAESVKTITFVEDKQVTSDAAASEGDGTTETGTTAAEAAASGDQAQQTLAIDWTDTTSYYMEKHPGSNVTYFAPINNAGLFSRTNSTAPEIQGQNVEIRNLKINDSKIINEDVTYNDVYVNADEEHKKFVGLSVMSAAKSTISGSSIL